MFQDILKKYRIDPKQYLELARLIADKQGYDPVSLTFSQNPSKKLNYAGRDFGASGYMDYILYNLLVPELAEKKRKNYRARATKTAKETQDKYSPASLALNILW